MSTNSNKPSILFWVIGIIALIWNAMGVNAYLQEAYNTDAYKAMHSEDQLELIDNLPAWYTAVFAIAVFVSVIACLLLLFKNKLAVPAFLIALIAVIIQTGYNVFINEGRELYGVMEYSMLVLIPMCSLFLYWYSKKALAKGWLS